MSSGESAQIAWAAARQAQSLRQSLPHVAVPKKRRGELRPFNSRLTASGALVVLSSVVAAPDEQRDRNRHRRRRVPRGGTRRGVAWLDPDSAMSRRRDHIDPSSSTPRFATPPDRRRRRPTPGRGERATRRSAIPSLQRERRGRVVPSKWRKRQLVWPPNVTVRLPFVSVPSVTVLMLPFHDSLIPVSPFRLS